MTTLGCSQGTLDYEEGISSAGNGGATFTPKNEFFDIIGLTSVLCSEDPVAVEEENWSAIRSMER